ncbi:MAG: hypothetical protein ABIR81_08560, partial [Ginsengibacter sp.]
MLAIISDNRPGLFNRTVHSVYITHQLKVKAGSGLASKIINRLHHFLIKKFDECWAPDDQNNTLAGELSFCDNLGN